MAAPHINRENFKIKEAVIPQKMTIINNLINNFILKILRNFSPYMFLQYFLMVLLFFSFGFGNHSKILIK